MAITFECEGCGKSYTVRDDFAGKTGQCKQCGQRMTIPTESDSEGYGLEGHDREPEPAAAPEPASLPPRTFKPAPQASAGRRATFSPPGGSEPKKSFFGGNNQGRGAIGVLVFLVVFGLRFYSQWQRNQARNAQNAPINAEVPNNPPQFAPPPVLTVDPSSPIVLPNFPDPGPVQELEPGVTRREIVLGPPDPVPGGQPGHCGRLWLYLPAGDHEAKSLPCILIAGAGATLFSGMKLSDGDVPEHLPYVKAGYAVMAYEVDGMIEDREGPGRVVILKAAQQFQAARAGLVNAHIALEYVLAKVPEVDPKRIMAVGHSSAGTLALLFAEFEPRLRSCVAFAPVDDVAQHFRKINQVQVMDALTQSGYGNLFTVYAPRTNEAKLTHPLFLFYAQDDASAEGIAAFGDRLKASGQPVTISTVPDGGHYDPMIRDGIPAAIAWLKEQDAATGR